MSGQPSGILEGRLSRVVLDGEIPSSLPAALEADRAQASPISWRRTVSCR